MTLVKGAVAPYIDQPKLSKPGRRSIRFYDQHDSTLRIQMCLAYKHRVGLLAFSNVLVVGYVAYDKVISKFV